MDLSQYDKVQYEMFKQIQEYNDFTIYRFQELNYLYREYEIPKFIGRKQILPKTVLLSDLEARSQTKSPSILTLQEYIVTSKVCLLFECYIKNFDEELSKRRNTSQYWSEEELYNTFQACLAALKTLHDNNIIHGAISPQSIIFGQDQTVKLADHFVVANEYKRNWMPQPQSEEYGYWAPEIVNEYDGWRQKFETIEGDIYSLGLVFLEALTLRSSLDYYFVEGESLLIDYQLIENALINMRGQYSVELLNLVTCMLVIDPLERTWDQVIQSNIKIQDLHNKLIIHPIPEESEEESQTDNNENDKQKLIGMLESCLMKSKQLIHDNESRKSKRPSQENVLKSQSSPCKEESLNSSVRKLMRTAKHSKKNSNESITILKEIPQNKQRVRTRDQYERLFLVNQEPTNGTLDINNLNNWENIYQSYNGETKDQKPHGKGQLTFINGVVFQGSFINGVIQGYGIVLLNGEIIVGSWEQNQLQQIL
ncbi:hypothetical protein pb186bvf_001047 [Paramecium bursaria]